MLRRDLTGASMLAYCNQKAHTQVTVDTSPVTLDTFLVQDTTHNDSNRERSTSPWVGLPVILFAFVWPPRV